MRFDQVGGVTSEKWEFFFVGLAVGSFKPEGQSKWRREEKFSLEMYRGDALVTKFFTEALCRFSNGAWEGPDSVRHPPTGGGGSGSGL